MLRERNGKEHVFGSRAGPRLQPGRRETRSTAWRDVGVGRGAVVRHARRAWPPRSATTSKERTLLAHLVAPAQLQPPREHRARTWTDLIPVLREAESPDLQARTRVQRGSMPLACKALTGGEGRCKRHCERCQGKENSCAHGCCSTLRRSQSGRSVLGCWVALLAAKAQLSKRETQL